jgi:hypothetical protein
LPGLTTRLAGLVAATVLVAAAGAGIVSVSAPPAAAAACSGSSGVTVVVDHGALGGGIDQVCSASGGGKAASSILEGAGFSLTYVQQQPGFVCRINGQPSSDPCVRTPPTDAYWGLFWSDGRSGSWSYSSVAAGSLTIPDGGYVGFAWQNGGQHAPGVPATAHSGGPTPTPSAAPSPTSGGGGGKGGGGCHHSARPTPKPSSKPSSKPTSKPSGKPSTTPSVSPTTAPSARDSAGTDAAGPVTPTSSPTEPASLPATTSAAATAATSSSDVAPATVTSEADDPGSGGSLPVWVVPAVLGVLVLTGLALVLVRRRHRPGP